MIFPNSNDADLFATVGALNKTKEDFSPEMRPWPKRLKSLREMLKVRLPNCRFKSSLSLMPQPQALVSLIL